MGGTQHNHTNPKQRIAGWRGLLTSDALLEAPESWRQLNGAIRLRFLRGGASVRVVGSGTFLVNRRGLALPSPAPREVEPSAADPAPTSFGARAPLALCRRRCVSADTSPAKLLVPLACNESGSARRKQVARVMWHGV